MSAGSSGIIGVQNSLDLLAPKFKLAVVASITACVADGLDAMVYETARSHELAVLYYAKGRTMIPPKEKVTNAPDETYSYHGYGLAVDVISKTKQWNKPESWFAKVAVHFKANGCKWGGDWHMKDLPHMQWGLCKPSPSTEARRILREEGLEALWKVVGAI